MHLACSQSGARYLNLLVSGVFRVFNAASLTSVGADKALTTVCLKLQGSGAWNSKNSDCVGECSFQESGFLQILRTRIEVAVDLDVEAARLMISEGALAGVRSRTAGWTLQNGIKNSSVVLHVQSSRFCWQRCLPTYQAHLKPELTNGYIHTQKLGWSRSTALSVRAHGLVSRRWQIAFLGKPQHSVCHSPRTEQVRGAAAVALNSWWPGTDASLFYPTALCHCTSFSSIRWSWYSCVTPARMESWVSSCCPDSLACRATISAPSWYCNKHFVGAVSLPAYRWTFTPRWILNWLLFGEQ